MFSKAIRQVVANLDVIPFAFEMPRADLDWVRCVDCQRHLDLHQPDLRSPARFLGVCEGCRHWFLVLIEADHAKSMMVRLPEDQAFKAAWDSHPDGV